jgi:hypothetical protein
MLLLRCLPHTGGGHCVIAGFALRLLVRVGGGRRNLPKRWRSYQTSLTSRTAARAGRGLVTLRASARRARSAGGRGDCAGPSKQRMSPGLGSRSWDRQQEPPSDFRTGVARRHGSTASNSKAPPLRLRPKPANSGRYRRPSEKPDIDQPLRASTPGTRRWARARPCPDSDHARPLTIARGGGDRIPAAIGRL